jgi:hypothetical protein
MIYRGERGGLNSQPFRKENLSMIGTCRVSFLALSTLIAVAAGAGCSSENAPATNAGGSGGTAPSTGGSGAGEAGTGGDGAGDTGGASGSGASGGSAGDGSGGSTGGTSGGEDFTPACDLTMTVAGLAIAKGVACVAEDPQLCWKTCGPQSVGWKSETCTGGIYAEGDCVFPSAGDYQCFKIPEAQHAECPTTAELMPQASQACTVPECNACNVAGQYKTSSGEVKVGYCVCQPPNSAGTRTWSCASGTAWPCPLGQGC